MSSLYRDYADEAPDAPVMHPMVTVAALVMTVGPWWYGMTRIMAWALGYVPFW